MELFHAGRRPFKVAVATCSPLPGDESGVRLMVCLCPGRSGVKGGGRPPIRLKREARCRRLGSDDGVFVCSFGGKGGVSGTGDFELPCLNLLASLRNGEMDLEMGLPGLRPPLDLVLFGGVSNVLFGDRDVTAELLDPASLGVASANSILRTDSISLSVRDILSCKWCHL